MGFEKMEKKSEEQSAQEMAMNTAEEETFEERKKRVSWIKCRQELKT